MNANQIATLKYEAERALRSTVHDYSLLTIIAFIERCEELESKLNKLKMEHIA